MSLELAINENTAAIRQLIGLLSTGDVMPQGTTVAHEAAPTPAPAPAPAPVAPPKQKAPKPAPAPVQAEPAPPSTVATYEEVAALVTKVSKVLGRAAALELLGKFNGARNLRDVPPSKFQDVVEEATAVLA